MGVLQIPSPTLYPSTLFEKGNAEWGDKSGKICFGKYVGRARGCCGGPGRRLPVFSYPLRRRSSKRLFWKSYPKSISEREKDC